MTPTPPEQVEATDAAELVALTEAVAELQLAAFLAGRGSVTSMKNGTRTSKPCPTMDEFRSMARATLTNSDPCSCTAGDELPTRLRRVAVSFTIRADQHRRTCVEAATLIETLTAKLSASEAEVARLTKDRAAVMSEWTDRPMLVDGREFEAGQVTIIDILDHAAASYRLKQEVRAKLHDWQTTKTGSSQCQKCGEVAWSQDQMRSDCSGDLASRLRALARQEPEGSGE